MCKSCISAFQAVDTSVSLNTLILPVIGDRKTEIVWTEIHHLLWTCENMRIQPASVKMIWVVKVAIIKANGEDER